MRACILGGSFDIDRLYLDRFLYCKDTYLISTLRNSSSLTASLLYLLCIAFLAHKHKHTNTLYRFLTTSLPNQRGLFSRGNRSGGPNNNNHDGIMSSPSSVGNKNSEKANTSSTPPAPHLTLTMSEYYFFTFVRFSSAQQLSSGRISLRSVGGSYWKVGPANNMYSGSAMKSNLSKFNNTTISTYNRLLNAYLAQYFPLTRNNSPTVIKPDAEFFLRLIVEFWLEENAVITSSATLNGSRNR